MTSSQQGWSSRRLLSLGRKNFDYHMSIFYIALASSIIAGIQIKAKVCLKLLLMLHAST